jgi:hypothetical protein
MQGLAMPFFARSLLHCSALTRPNVGAARRACVAVGQGLAPLSEAKHGDADGLLI